MLDELLTWWFLDLVVEGGIAIGALTAPNSSDILNRRTHGLSPDELKAAIADLMGRGLIFVRSSGGHLAGMNELNDVFRASQWGWPPTGYWYFLTDRGGDWWEDRARPNWSLFLDVSFDAERNVFIEAGDRETAEKEFRELQPEYPLDPGSRRDEELRPWEATYWKVFPRGHRITWHASKHQMRWPPRAPTAWYSNPFA